ncbi:DUF6634 family protein [Nitrobacteraceae bacterium UC4446_H13]
MLTQLYPFLDPIQSAPLIDEWIIAQTPAGLQLIGNITGRPHLRGRMAMTSPLWFADPAGRWVRTLSRFYRLGTSADPNTMRQVLSKMAGSNAPGDDDGSEGTS